MISSSAGKIAEKLAHILFYNSLIRVVIEGYMSLALACFIGLATFDPKLPIAGWPTFNLLLSIFLLLVILGSPFVPYQIIYKNRARL
jgi:hypothetical protein